MAVEVLGRDARREAYRVAVVSAAGRRIALIPETMMSEEMRRPGSPRHQGAYEWIAAKADRIERAVNALASGAPTTAPFDRIELAEEN